MKNLSKLNRPLASLILGLAYLVKTAPAQAGGITNPAIPSPYGGDAAKAASGETFSLYFVTAWQSLITVGGLLLVLYFIWGGIMWMTAAGEKSKLDKARDQMTQAVIGFVILMGTFATVGFIGSVLGIDLLTITLPTV